MKHITRYPLRITIPIFLFVAGSIISTYSMISNLRAVSINEENAGITFVMQSMSELQGTVNFFLREGNHDGIKLAIANRGSNQNIEYLLLTDENNVINHATQVDFLGIPIQQAVPDIDAALLNDANKTMSGKVVISKNRDFIYAYYPVVIGAKPHELRPSLTGILFAKYDLTYRKATRRYELESQSWQTILLYSVLFLSIGVILYYAMTKRVLRLVTATKRFAAGDISARSGLQGKDELALLGQELDSLIETIVREQAELKRTEEKLRLTRISVEAASDALFWMTPDARIVDVNEAACRSLGYTREELLQLSVSDVDPHYKAEVWQQHFPELRKHGTLMFETEHRAKDSSVFPVEIVANYIKVGTEEYNCAFVRNITERKRIEMAQAEMETRLRQSQKMEAIGTLAGGIAHDFNNILSAIFGYTELAIDEKDDEQRNQDLEQVRLGAERAKDLVKQILAFSRKSEQERQPLQVGLVIKEAMKMLRSSIPTTIEIKQDIISKGTVLADPTQIHQIIMNLCTNAYHAMRETGGTLAVSLGEIEIRGEDEGYGELVPGRYLKLEVSDTGGGISPEIQEKIFEPYFTTKKIGEGTGLGLAVVHGITKSHHGHITVYSEQGRGTTFHVYLPLVEEMTVAIPTKEDIADLTGRGERILFVDDEKQIREYADTLFSMHGYQVTPFMHGVQALEEFQKHPGQYDLIITDMTMPYMTGAELAQKILGIRPDIPIILCTGQSELVNREKALAMGICDYLTKPVTKHHFLSAIRKALDKNGPQADSAGLN